MPPVSRRIKQELRRTDRDIDHHLTQIIGTPLAVEGIMKVVKRTGNGSAANAGNSYMLIGKLVDVRSLIGSELQRREESEQHREVKAGRETKILKKLEARLDSLAANYSRSFEQPKIVSPRLHSEVKAVKQEHRKKIENAIFRALEIVESELQKGVPSFKNLARIEEALGPIDSIIQSFIEYYGLLIGRQKKEFEADAARRKEKAKKEKVRETRDLKITMRSTFEEVRKHSEALERELKAILGSEDGTAPASTDPEKHSRTIRRTISLETEASRVIRDAKEAPADIDVGRLEAAQRELIDVFYRYLEESARVPVRELAGSTQEH